MDRLDRYLDEVCRGVGGPRSLRQHLRRELGEHLRDAAADHRAAGLSEAEAVDRAIADFGRPQDVREELAATHGQRLLAVVVDKALEWKERTMTARLVWLSWAHGVTAGVIAVQIMFLVFAELFLTPKFRKILQDFGAGAGGEPAVAWASSFLAGTSAALGNHPWLWILGVAAAWGLFEWRVRGEHKPVIRLSALGTVALGLALVVALTGAALVIPLMLIMPGLAPR
jgi:hypothetical protein